MCNQLLIVFVDRGLAAIAIEDVSGGFAAPDRQWAEDVLLQGDMAALEGDFVGAVENYRDAWWLAVVSD